jgi:hypothetical protein
MVIWWRFNFDLTERGDDRYIHTESGHFQGNAGSDGGYRVSTVCDSTNRMCKHLALKFIMSLWDLLCFIILSCHIFTANQIWFKMIWNHMENFLLRESCFLNSWLSFNQLYTVFSWWKYSQLPSNAGTLICSCCVSLSKWVVSPKILVGLSDM